MEVCIDQNVDATKKTRWDRMVNVRRVVDSKAMLEQGSSQTITARKLGVPRTTLQYWLAREGKTGLSPAVEAFFETPDGLVFLHQLIISLQFIMHEVGPCGIDLVVSFLSLSQLSKFVASSHGSVYKQSEKMKDTIIQFEKKERGRLSSKMPPTKKKISICLDETFHPNICLVAMEPVSNFILLEKYDDKRDAKAWSKAMQEATGDLSIEIIQATGDQGAGLMKYVEKELGAPHSSDLFHVQQDLTRATSAPLRSKVRQAETAYQDSTVALERLMKEQESYVKTNKAPYSWSEFDQQMNIATADEEAALRHLNEIKKYQGEAKESKKALGFVYHPYDLSTGKAQTAEEVIEKMEEHFTIIQSAAIGAELSENNMKHLDKAHRVLKGMFNTMLFFWSMVKQQIIALGLSSEIETLMNGFLIPGFYLQIAGKKAKTAAERHRIANLSKDLFAQLELLDTWVGLAQPLRDQMSIVAKNCANLFQRSSSCVEGRNGYLSLRHHSSHQLSDKKLSVLTIIHNYFIRRLDGTTAAERFFEEKSADLFGYLLDNLELPARPAKSRKALLMAA